MKHQNRQFQWGIGLLITLFAYNNCGRPGFYAINEEGALNIESSGADNSSSADYLLSCLPRTSSTKLSYNETNSASTEVRFHGKWAYDIADVTSSQARTRGLTEKVASPDSNIELPETILVDIDHTCLNERGALSAITRLPKIQNAVSPLARTMYKLTTQDLQTLSLEEIKESVDNDLCITHVDKNASFTLSAVTANDTYLANQKNLEDISFGSVYSRVYNSQNGVNRDVRIAILDSGLDVSHPDIAANVLKDAQGAVVSYNPISNNSDVTDSSFHGTHVAGIAAAVSNNSQGIAGVMGVHAKIIAVKVSADGTNVDLDAVINGIRWAVDQGAEVINMSFSSNRAADDRPSFRAAVEYALEKGVVLVAASGNANTLITSSNHFYPAKYSALYPGFITVGSTDAASSTSARSSFSNFGPEFVKIMAPGQNGSSGILSTVPAHLNASGLASKANSNPIHGTSMAAPVVTGAAAIAIGMAKSRGYNATPDQIEKLLLRGAKKLTSLSSSAKDGNKVDLLTMINLIDSDTGISSNSTTDRKFAKGAVAIQKQPTNQQALLGTPVELSVEPTTSSSILLNYTWTRNGVVLSGEKKSTLKITPVQAKDAGLYDVTIRAGSTIVTSQKVKLELAPTYCN